MLWVEFAIYEYPNFLETVPVSTNAWVLLLAPVSLFNLINFFVSYNFSILQHSCWNLPQCSITIFPHMFRHHHYNRIGNRFYYNVNSNAFACACVLGRRKCVRSHRIAKDGWQKCGMCGTVGQRATHGCSFLHTYIYMDSYTPLSLIVIITIIRIHNSIFFPFSMHFFLPIFFSSLLSIDGVPFWAFFFFNIVIVRICK